jgi:transketolase
VLDDVLAATADRDVTVLYAHSVRPFDAATSCARAARPDVVLVEPWLAGTSARVGRRRAARRAPPAAVARHRVWSCATTARPPSTSAAHGLDAAGIRRSLESFLAA